MNKKQAAVQFIFITILLDAMGLGVIIPVLPDVLRRFTSDPTLVSERFGLFVGAYALMQFVASPILGSLSDRYGRRSILLFSLLGAAADYMFMAFAPTLPLLFVGRAISGLTGASMTVASSYMADISDDKNRSANFGMIGAGWGIGFIVGPMIGGMLSKWGATAPFIAAACLNALNFLYGFFVLPESLPANRRRNVQVRDLNPVRMVLKVLSPSSYVAYIWIYFLIFLAGQIHPVNWTLYTETKFHWTPWQVGLSLSFIGVMIAIGHGGMTRVIIPRLGEHRSLTAGIAIYGAAFALFSLAPRAWMLYPVMMFFGLAGITMPSLQSILAKHVPPDRQGELQGSLVSLGSAAAIIAPMMFTRLFVHFTRPGASVYFPGAAYMGAATISAFTLCLRLWAGRGGAEKGGLKGQDLIAPSPESALP